MSIQAINWAIATRVGDPVLKILLFTLANYANVEDQTWHDQERIAYDTEISVRTLRRRLHELVELGFITVEERRREDGRRASSMITLIRDQPDKLADGTTGQKDGSPPATTVAAHRTVTKRNKDSMSSGEYPEEFEDLWKQYPRRANTSKKKAHDIWRMLSVENQSRVRAAVPIFAASMRAEGRPEDKIKHFQFFLSEKIYETVNDPTTIEKQRVAVVDAWKTATREQWAKCVQIWRNDSNWRPSWGPLPGTAGCMVPIDLFVESDKWLLSHRRDPRIVVQAAE